MGRELGPEASLSVLRRESCRRQKKANVTILVDGPDRAPNGKDPQSVFAVFPTEHRQSMDVTHAGPPAAPPQKTGHRQQSRFLPIILIPYIG